MKKLIISKAVSGTSQYNKCPFCKFVGEKNSLEVILHMNEHHKNKGNGKGWYLVEEKYGDDIHNFAVELPLCSYCEDSGILEMDGGGRTTCPDCNGHPEWK
jgi:hypothetical protein